MKKITLCILLGLLVSNAVLAQSGSRQGKSDWQRPDISKRVAHMSVELELTEEQTAKLLEVMAMSEAERETLSEQHLLDMCSLRDRSSAQIEDILTDEQSIRFAELKTQMEMRRGERRGQQGRNHPQKPDCDP
jgi:hypothetical protein